MGGGEGGGGGGEGGLGKGRSLASDERPWSQRPVELDLSGSLSSPYLWDFSHYTPLKTTADQGQAQRPSTWYVQAAETCPETRPGWAGTGPPGGEAGALPQGRGLGLRALPPGSPPPSLGGLCFLASPNLLLRKSFLGRAQGVLEPKACASRPMLCPHTGQCCWSPEVAGPCAPVPPGTRSPVAGAAIRQWPGARLRTAASRPKTGGHSALKGRLVSRPFVTADGGMSGGPRGGESHRNHASHRLSRV